MPGTDERGCADEHDRSGWTERGRAVAAGTSTPPVVDGRASTQRLIRVVLVDGHQLLAHALATTLSAAPLLDVVGVLPTLDLTVFRRLSPDVLIVSYVAMLLHRETLETLPEVLPGLRMIVLTALPDEETLELCIQIGAVGYLTKDQLPSDLAEMIRQAWAGAVLF